MTDKPFFKFNGSFGFDNLWEVEILVFYDCPIMFVVKDDKDRLFFVQYLGCDVHGKNWTKETWMLAETTEQGIKDLKANKLTLRDAFIKPKSGIVYYITYERSAGRESIAPVLLSQIPDIDLPDADVYLDWEDVAT